jgi:hypothetical protein
MEQNDPVTPPRRFVPKGNAARMRSAEIIQGGEFAGGTEDGQPVF